MSDVAKASASNEQLILRDLPVQAFPSLSKFMDVQQIRFHQTSETFDTDQKLQILSQMQFPRLRDVNLQLCHDVSDAGLCTLTNFRSIQLLQVEGTSVSDASMRAISSSLPLKGINIVHCKKVTANGVYKLAEIPGLEELTFSVENLTSDEVDQVVAKLNGVKWCTIVDPSGKLDSKKLEEAASKRGIYLSVLRRLNSTRNDE